MCELFTKAGAPKDIKAIMAMAGQCAYQQLNGKGGAKGKDQGQEWANEAHVSIHIKVCTEQMAMAGSCAYPQEGQG